MNAKEPTVVERECAFADAEAILALANNSPILVETLTALAKPEACAADAVGAAPVNDPYFQQLRRAVTNGRMTFDEAVKAIIGQARKKERRRLADDSAQARGMK